MPTPIRFLLVLLFISTLPVLAEGQFQRARSIAPLPGERCVIIDSGTRELIISDTSFNLSRIQLPSSIIEPVAIAIDGLQFVLFDAGKHQLVTLNRRYEIVSNFALPMSSYRKCLPVVGISSIGERIMLEVDTREVFAFDRFGNSTWSFRLPEPLEPLQMACERDSLAIICATSDSTISLLHYSRFGTLRHESRMKIQPSTIIIPTFTTHQILHLISNQTQADQAKVQYHFTPDKPVAACISGSVLYVVSNEGLRTWRIE